MRLNAGMKRLLLGMSLWGSLCLVGDSQITLIGPSMLNGSFESGVAAPWEGVEVNQDSTFASDGSRFAILQSATSPTARDLCFQFLTASPGNGFTFIATFDARNGTPGFDSVSVSFF